MGDEKLIEAYSELRARLHRTAVGLLRDDAAAQDAMQDAFCNLWEAGAVESDAEARGKLMTTLRNVCLNMLRRRRQQCEIGDEAQAAEEHDPAAAMDGPVLAAHLLGLLSPLQRDIMVMRAERCMECEVIAERLGMSVEAVRVNISRARKKMYEAYKHDI